MDMNELIASVTDCSLSIIQLEKRLNELRKKVQDIYSYLKAYKYSLIHSNLDFDALNNRIQAIETMMNMYIMSIQLDAILNSKEFNRENIQKSKEYIDMSVELALLKITTPSKPDSEDPYTFQNRINAIKQLRVYEKDIKSIKQEIKSLNRLIGELCVERTIVECSDISKNRVYISIKSIHYSVRNNIRPIIFIKSYIINTTHNYVYLINSDVRNSTVNKKINKQRKSDIILKEYKKYKASLSVLS